MRELHVAARRRSTFQIRFLGAVGATLFGGVVLMASTLPGVPGVSGRGLFLTLMGAAMAMALVSGTILTADSLSREKREGTLGLLFLTDLTGLDVVAGKYVALSLVPFQGFLSVFPVVAMSIFMGGVTPGEFWRVLLVVVTTIFLSLSVGMWVSSRVTEDREAVWGSLLWMTGLSVAPAFLSALASLAPGLGGWADVRVLGPVGVFERAQAGFYGTKPSTFWLGVAIQWGLAGFFLGRAAWRVKRDWRLVENARRKSPVRVARWTPRWWTRIVDARGARLRRMGNLAWLGWQGEWMRRVVWGTVAVTCLAGLTTFWVSATQQPFSAGARSMGVVSTGLWMMKVMLAAHTVHFLHETCRNGMMELLMLTPIPGAAMWRGHLAAVRGIFLWPFLALAVLQIGLGIGGRMAMGGDWPSFGILVVTGLVPAVLILLVHALDFVAVAYYSARWALHYDRPGKALFRTLLLVIALPGLFCSHGRFVVDLLVMARTAGDLDRFRELVRGWFVPRVGRAPTAPPRLA